MHDFQVLIIDDDPDILDIWRELLGVYKLKIEATGNGIEAIHRIQNKAYDLIITDLELPGASGLQIIACVKLSRLNPQTPVVVASGYIDENMERLKSLGSVHLFPKGTSPKVLGEMTKQILELDKPRSRPIGYHPDILQLFKDTAQYLFSYIINDESIVVSPPKIVKAKAIGQGMSTGSICLFGSHIFGSTSVSCDGEMIKLLARRLLQSDEPIEPIEYLDLTGEISNQFAGKLKFELAERDIHIVIGIPEVLTHNNHMIPRHVPTPTVSFHINYEDANAWIDFSLGNPRLLNVQPPASELNIFLYDEDANRKKVS